MKLAHVVLHFFAADHLVQVHAVICHANRETIRLGHIVNVIGGNQAAGAGHILDDHLRIAGKIFRHIAGEQSRPAIVKSAGGKTNDDLDSFALVERFLLRVNERLT